MCSRRRSGNSARRSAAIDVSRTEGDLLARLELSGRQRFGYALGGMMDQIRNLPGPERDRALDGFLQRLQVILGHRRMSVGIYDHAFHVVGGGQKYVATLAAALQDTFDVTYLVHRGIDLV